MPKLDWLDNNDYLERETGRQYGWLAWFLWGIALVILLIPVRATAINQYYINSAEDTPSIVGHVIHLQPAHARRGISGGKGGHYDVKIDIEYKGESYYVTNTGFNFTHAMYKRALADGTVPVYLNPEHPEKSVLSKGVPFLQYFCTGLFAAAALALFVIGALLMRKRLQSGRK